MNKVADPSLANELAGVTPAEKVDTLSAYMEKRGQTFYDEALTQLEHALQCASQARSSGAGPGNGCAAARPGAFFDRRAQWRRRFSAAGFSPEPRYSMSGGYGCSWDGKLKID